MTERDVWIDFATEVLATARRKVGDFASPPRARSVILRRTMNFTLLGLLLLATSSRAILPVSVTLVEEQG